jgi:hypothetical protein
LNRQHPTKIYRERKTTKTDGDLTAPVVIRILSYPLSCIALSEPTHKQYLKRFLKKYPTADKNATYATIDVDPNFHWVANLEHEDRNSAKSYQVCSIQEDIKWCSSPDWDEQPAPAGCSCQWNVRY